MDINSLTLYEAQITLAVSILGLLSTLFSKNVRKIIFAPFVFLYKSFSNKALESKLDDIIYELTTNGGGSLKDAVKRLESAVDASQTAIAAVKEDVEGLKLQLETKQGALIAKFTAMLDQPSTPPMFEANAAGECIWVSSSYIAMIGRPLSELLGWGWVGSIHPDDAAEVRNKWELCVEEKRVFEHAYRFKDINGKTIKVRTRATPIMLNSEVTGWMGMITLMPARKPTSNVELLISNHR